MSRKELKDIVVARHTEAGHAVAGELIIAQARDIGKIRVVPGTHTHKIQETILRSNVLCVIDRPFKLKDGGMKLKE